MCSAVHCCNSKTNSYRDKSMKIKLLSTLPLLALIVSSCTTTRNNLSYFEDIQSQLSGALGSSDYSVKIEPQDELSVTVTSFNPEATAEYNLPMYNPATNAGGLSITQGKQQTFIVNREGNIALPSVGEVHVAGLTVDEAAQLIGNKISKDVKDPYVKVVLQNFQVNVLGEVNRPSRIGISKEKFSVLDAIAACGDLNAYGRRDNVLLIRETDGKKEFVRLNLNDSKLFDSPYFYLKQNDIIYVEPTKVKEANATYDQNRGFKLSIATAIISGISVVASMIIALCIK